MGRFVADGTIIHSLKESKYIARVKECMYMYECIY